MLLLSSSSFPLLSVSRQPSSYIYAGVTEQWTRAGKRFSTVTAGCDHKTDCCSIVNSRRDQIWNGLLVLMPVSILSPPLLPIVAGIAVTFLWPSWPKRKKRLSCCGWRLSISIVINTEATGGLWSRDRVQRERRIDESSREQIQMGPLAFCSSASSFSCQQKPLFVFFSRYFFAFVFCHGLLLSCGHRNGVPYYDVPTPS